MNRVQLFAVSAILFFIAGIFGCAGSAGRETGMPTTLVTVKPAKGYLKKIAVALTQAPETRMGINLGDLFFNALVQSIRAEDKNLLLATPNDDGYPDFMARIHRQPTSRSQVDAIELARQGRQAGYNGLLSASIGGVRPYTKKTGLLWFRKVRHFISFDLTVELYDTVTAAKIVSAVEEASVKVSEDEYEAVMEDMAAEVEALEEKIVGFGEKLGELVAESLRDRLWMTSVVGADGQRISLPAGQDAGLKVGVRLVVFEGQRRMDGMGSERFIVPGLRIGTIEVTELAPDHAGAAVIDGGPVQTGDIAIPVK